jgi:hypothetical protein
LGSFPILFQISWICSALKDGGKNEENNNRSKEDLPFFRDSSGIKTRRQGSDQVPVGLDVPRRVGAVKYNPNVSPPSFDCMAGLVGRQLHREFHLLLF